MRRYLLIFLALTLMFCSTEQGNIEVIDTSTTTQDSPIESYKYDSDKMSPFTGLELPPEIWLKRPRRVIAFKIDNNLNARPQSGLQEADSVMEILVEGGMTRFLAFYMDRSSSYVGPIR